MATTSRATAALHDDTLGTRIVAAGQRSGVLTRDATVDLLCSRLCLHTTQATQAHYGCATAVQ